MGTGVTLEAGGPRTSDLTKAIFYGGTDDARDANIRSFIGRMKCEVEKYYEKHSYPRVVSYEDVYEVIKEVADSEIGQWDNPVVDAFVDRIKPKIIDMLNKCDMISEKEIEEGKFISVSSLCKDSLEYISNRLVEALKYTPVTDNKDAYLKIFVEADSDARISGVDIFSLNCDLLVESFFNRVNQKFRDGFGRHANCKIDVWQPQTFSAVNLIKLHGSIDWYHLQGLIGEPDLLARGTQDRPPECPANYRAIYDPVLLIGTFTKMLAYSSFPFTDLLCLFHQRLRVLNRLVISGYSFGDQGINNQIMDWLWRGNEQNKIIVIHPDFANLTRVCRPAARSLLNGNESFYNGRVNRIPRRFENVSWDLLREQVLG